MFVRVCYGGAGSLVDSNKQVIFLGHGLCCPWQNNDIHGEPQTHILRVGLETNNTVFDLYKKQTIQCVSLIQETNNAVFTLHKIITICSLMSNTP